VDIGIVAAVRANTSALSTRRGGGIFRQTFEWAAGSGTPVAHDREPVETPGKRMQVDARLSYEVKACPEPSVASSVPLTGGSSRSSRGGQLTVSGVASRLWSGQNRSNYTWLIWRRCSMKQLPRLSCLHVRKNFKFWCWSQTHCSWRFGHLDKIQCLL